MPALDTQLFLAINGLAGSSRALDLFGAFCAEPLIFLMAAAGTGRAGWLLARRDPRAARALAGVPRAAAASAAAFLGNLLFAAYVWFRARPYVVIPAAHLLLSEPGTPQSFPSGHSSVAFAIAFSSYFVDPDCGRWMLAGAAFVALGRVYVGVHYPLDVLAGAFVGLLWALAARAIGTRLRDADFVRRLLTK